jgi:cholesterol transport system auxiliary component
MIFDNQTENKHSGAVRKAASYRRSVRSLPALLALGLVAGCGASRPIKYYQLTIPGDLAPTTQQTVPVTILVRTPVAPDLYRDDRLVYSTGDYQLGSYEYERWASPAPELIQTVLVRSLRATGHYAGVFTPQSTVNGDYILVTRIYDFKEQDNGGTLTARVSMDSHLRNIKTGDIVWQSYYTHDEPISGKTVPEVVAALNRNVQAAATNIASGLDQYFVAHPPK